MADQAFDLVRFARTLSGGRPTAIGRNAGAVIDKPEGDSPQRVAPGRGRVVANAGRAQRISPPFGLCANASRAIAAHHTGRDEITADELAHRDGSDAHGIRARGTRVDRPRPDRATVTRADAA